MPVLKNLPRLFSFDRPRDVTSWYLVRRVEATLSIEPPWERRIVEVADGRPLTEVIEVLYQEQLDRGARLADLGMWKSLFDRCVIAAISDLVHRGVIDMNPDGGLERRRELSTTWEPKKSRLTLGTIAEKTAGRARLGRLAGVTNSHQDQFFGNPANGSPVPRYATPQKWSVGSRAPVQDGRVEQLETVRPGRVGVGQSALSENVIVPGRSLAEVVLGFLARVARRGSSRTGRRQSHAVEIEGR